MAHSSIGRLGKRLAKTVLHNTPEGATIFSIRESGVAYKTSEMKSYALYKTFPEVSMDAKRQFVSDFCNRVQSLNQVA